MNNKLNLESLPKMVFQLTQQIEEMKQMLLDNTSNGRNEVDDLLDVAETAEFLKLSVPTIYSNASKRELPHFKKAKKIYFSRIELTEYLKTGRVKTNSEIDDEANKYLLN